MPDTKSISPCSPRLAKSANLHSGRFKDFLSELMKEVSTTKKIDRVVFWMYHPINRTFNVVGAYGQEQDSFSCNEVISEDNAPDFYQTARNTFTRKISRIENSTDLAEIRGICPTMFPVKSLLMQQVRFDGKLLGLLSFEQITASRDWNAEDEMEMGAATSILQQAYQVSLRLKRERKASRDTLFFEAPVPFWVFDTDTLEILDGNKKALDLYDYSDLASFRRVKLMQLVHPSQKNQVESLLGKKNVGNWKQVELIQQRKDGLAFIAKLSSSRVTYRDREARVVVVTDSKKEKRIQREKDELERKLNDHAFYASHNLRSPIANILGLLDLIKISWEDRENYEELLYRLKIQTMNLDEAVRVMSAKIEFDQLSSGV